MSIVSLVVLYLILLYFLFMMPRRREQKRRNELYNSLKPGARISTVSGVRGTVIDITDQDVIVEISADPEKPIRARLMKAGVKEMKS